MSLENVKTYFAEYGMENRILEFSVSSATVDLAAQAVGCEPGRIAKTLSFCGEKGVEVFLDVSLRQYQTVYPACGSSNSAIELSIPELEKYSMFQGWIDVCRKMN